MTNRQWLSKLILKAPDEELAQIFCKNTLPNFYWCYFTEGDEAFDEFSDYVEDFSAWLNKEHIK